MGSSGVPSKFDLIIASLSEQGWGMSDLVWPEPIWKSLGVWARTQLAQGKLSGAEIGLGISRHEALAIRSDLTLWMEPEDQPDIFQYLETLRLILNEKLFLSLIKFECHLAYYPIGAFYKKHIDSSVSSSGERVISFVLYLNENWIESDGGQLRLNELGKDISPLGGRLILFRSDTVEHEVLPAFQNRWSLSGWFRCRGDHSSVEVL